MGKKKPAKERCRNEVIMKNEKHKIQGKKIKIITITLFFHVIQDYYSCGVHQLSGY